MDFLRELFSLKLEMLKAFRGDLPLLAPSHLLLQTSHHCRWLRLPRELMEVLEGLPVFPAHAHGDRDANGVVRSPLQYVHPLIARRSPSAPLYLRFALPQQLENHCIENKEKKDAKEKRKKEDAHKALMEKAKEKADDKKTEKHQKEKSRTEERTRRG